MRLTRGPRPVRAAGLAALLLLLAACGGSGGAEAGPSSGSEDSAAASSTTEPELLRVGVVGDSVGLTLALRATGVYEIDIRGGGSMGCGVVPRQECLNWTDAWAEVGDVDPDVVVVTLGPWEITEEDVATGPYVPGTPEAEALVLSELDRGAALVGDAPLAVLDVPCLRDDAGVERLPGEPIDWINGVLAKWVAQDPAARHILPISELVCPGGVEATVDGVVMREDGRHYSFESAPIAWRWMIPQLEEIADAAGG